MSIWELPGIGLPIVFNPPMLRTLPAVGHPIRMRTIFQSFLRRGKDQDSFQNRFPDRPVFWVGSGTGALTLSLESISRGSHKKQVILPAYTCPSVLASVIKAGLKPVLCDINLNDFNFKTENLKLKICEDTLAVIAVHLFGIPENIFNLRELTKKEGVVLIEDAAQAFGNKILLNSFSLNTPNLTLNTNQYLGSFGDIGIFSFGRGKPLSFLNGGAVLVNDEKYHKTVQEFHSSLSGSNHSPPTVLYFFNLLIYSIFYHPNLYWIPNNIPWLKLGETIFSLDFEIGRLNPNALRIGRALIKNFEKIREKRGQIARAYRDRLKNIQEEFVYIPEWDKENISLLRFPIVFKSKEKRNRILLELKERGLGATGMYPVPLNEQEGIPGYLFKEEGKLYPNAKHHSERILTLPLHEYVRIKDIEIICRVIEKHLKN